LKPQLVRLALAVRKGRPDRQVPQEQQDRREQQAQWGRQDQQDPRAQRGHWVRKDRKAQPE
jgi:hypothetical protein